jgi:signal peptidase
MLDELQPLDTRLFSKLNIVTTPRSNFGVMMILLVIGGLFASFGKGLYPPQTGPKKAKRAQSGSITGWIITTVVAVGIIWFAVGLFPIYPALVAGGSMEPKMYPGDVVIIIKTPADNVETGDIIQFRVPDGVTIMHRVIEIQETGEGSKVFITKGDATDKPDPEPVLPDNVVGKAIMTIPKVGWVSIAVKQFFMG